MKYAGKALLVALSAMLAACGDNTVAPKAQDQDVPNVSGGGITSALSSVDTARFSMTISAAYPTTIALGAGNSIRFPAGSVCDPSTSGYGIGTWDTACTPLRVPITVNVKAWMDGSGHARIDFNPNIRFVPSVLPTGWVELAFRDYAASQDPFFNILYCTDPRYTSTCIDEAKTDPTLATVKDPVTGQLSRRVKHFSGYMVGAGDDCSACLSGMNMSASKIGATSPAASHDVKYTAVKTRGNKPGTSASADIGPAGGTLRLNSAGLTVEVPPGAVSAMTHFSVSTAPGDFLGYSFEPHGTHFAVPLRATQSLRSLNAPANNLTLLGVAYYPSDASLNIADGTVLSSELLDIIVDKPSQNVSFNIWHFSGYMFVSGRSNFEIELRAQEKEAR
jgi:hypothetical protein